MSIVAIPFRAEEPGVVRRNLNIAASHPRVTEVWGVYAEEPFLARVTSGDLDGRVRFIQDQRVGSMRRGKGDGMNTALLAAEASGVDRLHFYDADITNFDIEWIDGAERAADSGYEVVRHRFPRAATDAMITWFITRPAFAIRYPDTVLPTISQPLGGELLLGRRAIADLAGNPAVTNRSDWGIDTAYTFWSVAGGHSLYEHQVPDGKRHALYGSLEDLRVMAIECFDTARSLPSLRIPDIDHVSEPDQPAPGDLTTAAAFSVELTTPLLTAPWVPGEAEALAALLPDLASPTISMQETGAFDFLDEDSWERVMISFLDAEAGSEATDNLFFRLWVGRVLHYTHHVVKRGYDEAMSYLHSTIETYEQRSLNRVSLPKSTPKQPA